LFPYPYPSTRVPSFLCPPCAASCPQKPAKKSKPPYLPLLIRPRLLTLTPHHVLTRLVCGLLIVLSRVLHHHHHHHVYMYRIPALHTDTHYQLPQHPAYPRAFIPSGRPEFPFFFLSLIYLCLFVCYGYSRLSRYEAYTVYLARERPTRILIASVARLHVLISPFPPFLLSSSSSSAILSYTIIIHHAPHKRLPPM